MVNHQRWSLSRVLCLVGYSYHIRNLERRRAKGLVNITIWWKDGSNPTRKQNVEIEEGLAALTVQESDTEYSRVMLHAVQFYDVEVL